MIELPKTFVERSDWESVLADVEAARGTTMKERAEILYSLCEMAGEFVAQHPDPQRALDWQDPIPASSQALLTRLRKAFFCHE